MPPPDKAKPDVILRPVSLPPVRNEDDWKSWPDSAKMELLAELEARVEARKPLPYWSEARPKQLPPNHERHHLPDENGFVCGCDGMDEDWSVWLLCAGRGIGKTYTGSNWITAQALATPGEYAVLAPTHADVKRTCIERAILPKLRKAKIKFEYNKSELEITLANGSKINGFTADNPERIRGANLSGAWCDEVGSWRYSSTWYEGLIPALRIGHHPRVVVTTTPRPTDLMFDLIKRDDGSVHLTSGSTFENVANLSPIALEEMKRRYDGTRIGLQELYGQLLEDIVGALWTREMIESARLGKRLIKGEWHDDMDDVVLTRIVVGVDPAVTSNEHSDETGIVVVGMDGQGHAYVIDDGSGKRTPRASLVEAIKAYRKWAAEGIVVEVNNGGDYIPELMATIDENVPVKVVRATRGKIIRAEPVASLYEQGRVHHYGFWEKLEEQMTSYVPAGKRKASPDRLDALVWAITALKNLEIGDFHTAYGTRNCEHCGKGYIVAAHPDACPFCKKRQAG